MYKEIISQIEHGEVHSKRFYIWEFELTLLIYTLLCHGCYIPFDRVSIYNFVYKTSAISASNKLHINITNTCIHN